MKRSMLMMALCSLAASSLACGILQAQKDAQATNVAAQIYGTQTANAPTATNTATVTNTPTATATATPTATSSPTITPTATNTPLPDASLIVLKEGDAPDTFERPPRADVEERADGLRDNENMQFASYSELLSNDTEEYLIAYVVYLLDAEARSNFGDLLRRPETIAKGFAVNTDATYQDSVAIEGIDDLGDSSAGSASSMRATNGNIVHLDLIVFRRGIFGVILYDIYLTQKTVDMVDIATILDGRVTDVDQ